VLASSGHEQYTLAQYQGLYLIEELDRLVDSGENALHLEAAIFLGLYYNTCLNPDITNDPTFVNHFKSILDRKGTFVYRYSPLQLAYTVRLTG
jgi:hypothetical protein